MKGNKVEKKQNWISKLFNKNPEKDLEKLNALDILKDNFYIRTFLLDNEKKGQNTQPFQEETRILDYFFRQINPNILSRNEYYSTIQGLYALEPTFKNAIDSYLAEVMIPTTSKASPIEVVSESVRVKKTLEKLLEDSGIDYNFIREIFKNILFKGDCWVRLRKVVINNETKIRLQILPPEVVKFPLQFTLADVIQDVEVKFKSLFQLLPQSSFFQGIQSIEGLQQFVKSSFADDKMLILEHEEINIGTILVDGTYLPPWECIRFTHGNASRLFFPFNESFLHGAVSPCSVLAQQKLMHSVARMANIPISVWKLKESPGRRTDEAMKNFNQLAHNLQSNLLSQERYTKNSGAGRTIFVEDKFDFEVISPNLDVDAIADLEFFEQQIAIATGIPINYVQSYDFNNTSGEALVKSHKPFRDKLIALQMSFLKPAALLINSIAYLLNDEKIFKIMEDGKFSFKMTLPSPDQDNKTTDKVEKLDGYISFLEKVAVISGCSEVAELSKDVKLQALETVYQDYDKDSVYAIIKQSLDEDYKPSKEENGDNEPITVASVEGNRLGELRESYNYLENKLKEGWINE